MSNLIKYEPVIVLELWSGRVHFIRNPNISFDAFVERMNTVKFLSIRGQERGINVKDIRDYYIDRYGVAGLNDMELVEFQSRKAAYLKNFGVEPPDDVRTALVLAVKKGVKQINEETPVEYRGKIIPKSELL